MRIENNKIVYERVTCWDCNGTKELKRYDLCPLNWQPVAHRPGRKCPHCGTKNRHSHKMPGTFKVVPCHTCEAQGTRMENSYDHISQELWNSWVAAGMFNFEVARTGRGSTLVEQYLGDPHCLYGCTDYGCTARMTDAEILAKVPMDGHPYQPVGWAPNDVVLSTMLILVKSDGYSVYQKA